MFSLPCTHSRILTILYLYNLFPARYIDTSPEVVPHTLYTSQKRYSTPFVLGTSSEPVLWIASLIASASALKADSALGRIKYGQTCDMRSEVGLLVVIIFASQYIDVQSYASGDCERVEDVWEHLCREVSYLLPLDAQVRHAVWARAYIYHCSR